MTYDIKLNKIHTTHTYKLNAQNNVISLRTKLKKLDKIQPLMIFDDCLMS